MGERLDDTLSSLLAGRFKLYPRLSPPPSRGRINSFSSSPQAGRIEEGGIEPVSALVRRALNYYQSGVESLKNGNWAKYGESQKLLKQTLKEIEKRTQ